MGESRAPRVVRLPVSLSLVCLAACPPPLPCGGARVSAGSGGEAVLTSASRPEATLRRGRAESTFLLDTGFRRSAMGPAAQAAMDAAPGASFELAGTHLEADFQPWALPQAQGVLGADVLGWLPLTLDAEARRLAVAKVFSPPAAGDAALRRHALAACDDPGVAYTLEASVEGRPVAWLLDTGAESSVLRTTLADGLSPPRATLSGVLLETAFAGVVRARAQRVASVSLGDGGAAWQVAVLSGQALDAELDRQSAWLSRAAGHEVVVDGLLGWDVLREGTVSFRGPASGPASALGFAAYPASPWPRRLVGVGMALVEEADGLRVASVYSPSPAAEAGVMAGDVLLRVDGRPAADAPTPFAAPGQVVTLQLRRGSETFERSLSVADLLPDAPPQ